MTIGLLVTLKVRSTSAATVPTDIELSVSIPYPMLNIFGKKLKSGLAKMDESLLLQ